MVDRHWTGNSMLCFVDWPNSLQLSLNRDSQQSVGVTITDIKAACAAKQTTSLLQLRFRTVLNQSVVTFGYCNCSKEAALLSASRLLHHDKYCLGSHYTS